MELGVGAVDESAELRTRAPLGIAHPDTLRDYLAVLRRRWWVLVLVPLLATLGAYWLATSQEATYAASASILVDLGSSSEAGGTRSQDVVLQTYSRLVTSKPVIERVITDLGLREPPATLAESVRARVALDSQIIDITAEYREPTMAAKIANATAESFTEWLEERQRTRSTQNTETLQTSLDNARTNLEQASSELANLRSMPGSRTPAENARIASLEALLVEYRTTYTGLVELQQRSELAVLGTEDRVELVDPAEPPSGPRGLPPALYALIGLMFGVGLAGMGVVVLESFSAKVRGAEDVHREVGLPVLGMIPRLRANSKLELLASPHSLTSESVRSLRARLVFASEGAGLGALVITSTDPKNGGAFVAANLAIAAAQSGDRVVLIDGDLRSPTLHVTFSVPNTDGLSSLLDQREADVAGFMVDTEIPNLRLLPSGPIPTHPSRFFAEKGLKETPVMIGMPSPAELLADDRLTEIITELKRNADLVLLSAPALLAIPDALLLAAAVDHAVILSGVGRTRQETLGRAVADLRATNVTILGVILQGGRSATFA